MSYVNIGKVTEELNELAGDKVTKGHEVIEFQAPTEANGYTWYRKYADGWVEQGGYHSNAGQSSAYTATINLIIPMANTTYQISRTADKNSIANDPGTRWISGANSGSRTTTSFTIFTDQVGYVYGDWWEVKGMYAQ